MAKVEGAEIKLSDLVQGVKGGQIDWGKQMMYASGEGVAPPKSEVPNRARAYLKAKDYARMAAIANLLMVIEGTTISYEGYGKDFMAKDVTLRQTIEGYVKNVEILRSERTSSGNDTTVKVWVGTRIYGDQTPGTAFLGKLADTEKPKQPPLIEIPLEKSSPRPSTPTKLAAAEVDGQGVASYAGPAASRPEDPEAMAALGKQEGPFTSLIVDARGYNVPQAICPKIRKLNGDQVYGSLLAKTDPAIRDGIVSYTRTPDAARESDRCGGNPFVVGAIGRGGGRSMCDVIVADGTAKQIVAENSAGKFLDQYKVIFVVDPPSSALSSSMTKAEPKPSEVRVALSDTAHVAKKKGAK